MNIKQKLSSRKLWAAIVGVVVGVALAFGVDGDTITNVAGAATAALSCMSYIWAEGKVDSARENNTLTVDGEEYELEEG